MNKSYVLLLMYDWLRKGKSVRITECCQEFEISVSTFRRYIAFLRTYFMQEYGKEIVYDPKEEKYLLQKHFGEVGTLQS